MWWRLILTIFRFQSDKSFEKWSLMIEHRQTHNKYGQQGQP